MKLNAVVVQLLLVVTLVTGDTSAAYDTGSRSGDSDENYSTDSQLDGRGGYNFFYLHQRPSPLQDTFRSETGTLVDAGGTNEHMNVEGEYSWQAPDGGYYTVTYIADDKGYRATVSSMPKNFKTEQRPAYSPQPGAVSSHDLNCAEGYTGLQCKDKLGNIKRDDQVDRPSKKGRD